LRNSKFSRTIEDFVIVTLFGIALYFIITFIYSFFEDRTVTNDESINQALIGKDTSTRNIFHSIENFILEISQSIVDRDNKLIEKEHNITMLEINTVKKVTETVPPKVVEIAKNKDINSSLALITKDEIRIIQEIQEIQDIKIKNVIKSIEINNEKSSPSITIPKVKAVKKNETILEKNKRNTSKYEKRYTSVNKFLKDIDIQIKEDASIDKTIVRTKIILTIMKDGRFQDYGFVSGDRNIMEEVNTSTIKVFPVPIPKNLRHMFPRYLRLTFN
jgi:hypothetical protein